MKRVAVLGSTGSIGLQTLDIVRLHPHRFSIVSLAAGTNIDLLECQVREFRPSIVSCATEAAAAELTWKLREYPDRVEVVHGTDGCRSVAVVPEADIVVAGLPGSTGLLPTFAAVEAGKDVALATKEVLVMAGELFMDLVRSKGVALLPVDSEQSAIFQCLQGQAHNPVRRIILTASGGPFRAMSKAEMDRVTRSQALDHPRWKMGPKVTVDSATLMNKGLEVIEAQWLFNVPASRIEVVIHPQSICHSMVEFEDGSILAQLGATDMRVPISYALACPDRVSSGTEPLDFAQLGSLTFEAPDFERFPLLKAAYDAINEGGSAPVILNAADEAAVELFLADRISFQDISRIVLECLERIPRPMLSTLEEITGFHDDVAEHVRRTPRHHL
ncbi:MAG: 1-deoxy-D-xylulose-5-phosphate reductoisomerase [Desulfomonile sp.]|nr:1-deoxy-D-xylulose-5-phosphate reductoisomerase [Desulfomonile sp.]